MGKHARQSPYGHDGLRASHYVSLDARRFNSVLPPFLPQRSSALLENRAWLHLRTIRPDGGATVGEPKRIPSATSRTAQDEDWKKTNRPAAPSSSTYNALGALHSEPFDHWAGEGTIEIGYAANGIDPAIPMSNNRVGAGPTDFEDPSPPSTTMRT